FKQDEIRQLLTTINKAANEASLPEKDLDVVFEKWWPDLAEEIGAIAAKRPSSGAQIRSEKDLVEENLLLTRSLVAEQQKLAMAFWQLVSRLGPSQSGPWNFVGSPTTGTGLLGFPAEFAS